MDFVRVLVGITLFFLSVASASACPRVETIGRGAALHANTASGDLDVVVVLGSAGTTWAFSLQSSNPFGESAAVANVGEDSQLTTRVGIGSGTQPFGEIHLFRRGAMLGDIVLRVSSANAGESFAMHISITDYANGATPRFTSLCIPNLQSNTDYSAWLSRLETALNADSLALEDSTQISNACEPTAPGCEAPVFVGSEFDTVPVDGGPIDGGRQGIVTPSAPASFGALLAEVKLLSSRALRARSLSARRTALRQLNRRLRTASKALSGQLTSKERKLVSRTLKLIRPSLKRGASSGKLRSVLRAVLRAIS